MLLDKPHLIDNRPCTNVDTFPSLTCLITRDRYLRYLVVHACKLSIAWQFHPLAKPGTHSSAINNCSCYIHVRVLRNQMVAEMFQFMCGIPSYRSQKSMRDPCVKGSALRCRRHHDTCRICSGILVDVSIDRHRLIKLTRGTQDNTLACTVMVTCFLITLGSSAGHV